VDYKQLGTRVIHSHHSSADNDLVKRLAKPFGAPHREALTDDPQLIIELAVLSAFASRRRLFA
jgi:hypothetical protein